MADFDLKAARGAGYSDAEIADHLAAQRGFDIQAARQSGYKDAEIVDHLVPPPRPGVAAGALAGTAGGYLGTQAARAAGGMLGAPGAMAKGVDWLYQQVGVDPASVMGPQGAKMLRTWGAEYPTGEDISGAALNAVGMKPVNLEGAIPGGKIIDTGVQGGMGALMTGGASLPAMLAGAFGGASSEIGGQVAEGTPYEVPARLAGAVIGGVGGAVTPSIVRKGAEILKGPVSPFTSAGRDKIVAQTLRSGAADPDAAVANLEKYQIAREAYPDAVPGFKIDAGKASRDTGLMSMADAMPDKIRGTQVQANNALATEALDRVTAGLPSAKDVPDIVQGTLVDRFKALTGARKAAADPHYTAARSSPMPVDPTDAWMVAKQVSEEGKGKPAKLMKEVAGYFESGAGTPKKLMATREAVGTLLDNPNLDKYRKGLLIEVQRKIDDALSVVPEEQAARSTFQQYSKPLEPFADKTAAGALVKKDRFGNLVTSPEKVTGNLNAKSVQNILMASGGDPVIKKALQSAYFDDFKNVVANNVQKDAAGNPMLGANPAAKWMKANRGGAANVLTPEQIGALDDIVRHIGDQAQTVPGRVGSQTFDRLATESIVGALVSKRYADAPFLHSIRKGLGLVYGGADDAIASRLYEVLADPAMAKALMKKATPGNVKMVEPLLQSIARGAALPVATAGERGSP